MCVAKYSGEGGAGRGGAGLGVVGLAGNPPRHVPGSSSEDHLRVGCEMDKA